MFSATSDESNCTYQNLTAEQWKEIADDIEAELDIYKPLYLR
jgi:hypothetical protein